MPNIFTTVVGKDLTSEIQNTCTDCMINGTGVGCYVPQKYDAICCDNPVCLLLQCRIGDIDCAACCPALCAADALCGANGQCGFCPLCIDGCVKRDCDCDTICKKNPCSIECDPRCIKCAQCLSLCGQERCTDIDCKACCAECGLDATCEPCFPWLAFCGACAQRDCGKCIDLAPPQCEACCPPCKLFAMCCNKELCDPVCGKCEICKPVCDPVCVQCQGLCNTCMDALPCCEAKCERSDDCCLDSIFNCCLAPCGHKCLCGEIDCANMKTGVFCGYKCHWLPAQCCCKNCGVLCALPSMPRLCSGFVEYTAADKSYVFGGAPPPLGGGLPKVRGPRGNPINFSGEDAAATAPAPSS